MTHDFPPTSRRRGFTLVELLVVVAIIALLMGLLLPVLSRMVSQGKRTKVAAELAGISTALDSYRQDFGDVPRFGTGGGADLNAAPDRGARLLCRALLGPAPENDPTLANGTDLSKYGGTKIANRISSYLTASATAFQDGFGDAGQPFGFKDDRQVLARGEAGAVTLPGKAYKPYLDPERFKVRDTKLTAYSDKGLRYGPDAVILDAGGSPVLYFPARRRPGNLSAANGFVAAGTNPTPAALFDAYDNRGSTADDTAPGLSGPQLRRLLGDADADGQVDKGETPTTTGPFLLVAAGSDGFRYDATGKTWSADNPVANVPLPDAKK